MWDATASAVHDLAESIRPVGVPYPDFFKGRLPDVKIDLKGTVAKQYTWMYGSVIKFSPRGGAVWFPITDKGPNYLVRFT